MNEILKALQNCKLEGRPCVIATIVKVEGSAYQREGARCIILSDGKVVGMLSGGCVEEELIKQAEEVRGSETPKLIHLDFSSEDDLLFGYGSGCGGKLHIWLEPFCTPSSSDISVQLLNELVNRNETMATYYAITVIDSNDPILHPIGTRWRVTHADPDFLPKSGQTGLVKSEQDHVSLVLFVEKIEPRPSLSVIGTGEDAIFLTRLAKRLGWHVRLVFHSTERATARFFPHVDEIVHLKRGDFTYFPDLPSHYAVVMSHQYEIDYRAVKQLLHSSVVYVGLLGSRTRIQRILEAINSEKVVDERLLKAKLYAPIGLDLGASTPEEITLSIMAELVAIHNKAGGGFLKERRERT